MKDIDLLTFDVGGIMTPLNVKNCWSSETASLVKQYFCIRLEVLMALNIIIIFRDVMSCSLLKGY